MSVLMGFIGMPGLPEMLIVGAIMLLLFGNRLPSVMRSLGRGVIEFKKGVQGIEESVDEAGSTPSSTSIPGQDHAQENAAQQKETAE